MSIRYSIIHPFINTRMPEGETVINCVSMTILYLTGLFNCNFVGPTQIGRVGHWTQDWLCWLETSNDASALVFIQASNKCPYGASIFCDMSNYVLAAGSFIRPRWGPQTILYVWTGGPTSSVADVEDIQHGEDRKLEGGFPGVEFHISHTDKPGV